MKRPKKAINITLPNGTKLECYKATDIDPLLDELERLKTEKPTILTRAELMQIQLTI